MKVIYFFLIIVDISLHQGNCAITQFEGFFRNPPVFGSLVMLLFVGQTWRPLFGLFARTIICEFLIV